MWLKRKANKQTESYFIPVWVNKSVKRQTISPACREIFDWNVIFVPREDNQAGYEKQQK